MPFLHRQSSSFPSESTRCKFVWFTIYTLLERFPNPTFFVLYRVFGALLVISFCDFEFVMRHFRFLKTVQGKGYFNLFLSSMFLVGSDDIWGWLMMGLFASFGIFFIIVGCACVEGIYDNSDIKKSEVADNARSSIANRNS